VEAESSLQGIWRPQRGPMPLYSLYKAGRNSPKRGKVSEKGVNTVAKFPLKWSACIGLSQRSTTAASAGL